MLGGEAPKGCLQKTGSLSIGFSDMDLSRQITYGALAASSAVLKSGIALLARAYLDDVLDVVDKELAVAVMTGVEG